VEAQALRQQKRFEDSVVQAYGNGDAREMFNMFSNNMTVDYFLSQWKNVWIASGISDLKELKMQSRRSFGAV
jgi:hypothetical protein